VKRFSGNTALVTGGASGIGKATALRLADEGANVIVADIDTEGARIVAKEIDGYHVTLDVTDDEAVRTAIAIGEETVAPIDVLVNNAGGGRFAMFVHSEPDVWDHELRLNLRGTLACTHAVLPGMCKRRSGSIVNVASAAGLVGVTGGATYAAAKAGVIGFTKSIAREAASFGVRCNAVAPGPVDTPLLDGMSDDDRINDAVRRGMVDSTILGRLARPDEIAAAIAFLASDDASYVIGAVLSVSGGASL
jgi:NAD(P)-dependent dehydrogenase (short-subunit alcohol dehydrogenase family)